MSRVCTRAVFSGWSSPEFVCRPTLYVVKMHGGREAGTAGRATSLSAGSSSVHSPLQLQCYSVWALHGLTFNRIGVVCRSGCAQLTTRRCRDSRQDLAVFLNMLFHSTDSSDRDFKLQPFILVLHQQDSGCKPRSVRDGTLDRVVLGSWPSHSGSCVLYVVLSNKRLHDISE